MLYNQPSPLEVKVLSRRFGLENSASIDTYLKYADAVGLTGLVAKPQLTEAAGETEVIVTKERTPARRTTRR